jgi:hypothetical protein
MSSQEITSLKRMRLELARSRAEAALEQCCRPADEEMDPEETSRIARDTVALVEHCMARLAWSQRVMLLEVALERTLIMNSREALRESRELLRLDVAAKGARIA